MEFGLREYLLILGAVLIVGLLAHGIRRTLKHKREGLKLDLIAAPPESPERSDVSKPRPVKKATPEELEPQVDADPLFESSDASQLNLWAGEIKAEAMKSADHDALVEDSFGTFLARVSVPSAKLLATEIDANVTNSANATVQK